MTDLFCLPTRPRVKRKSCTLGAQTEIEIRGVAIKRYHYSFAVVKNAIKNFMTRRQECLNFSEE